MNPKIMEAVGLFKELGWENVTAENVPYLPAGTSVQRRAAIAGLKSGKWGQTSVPKKNIDCRMSNIDVDFAKLGVFAVRVGVTAKRAANVLRYRYDYELLVKVFKIRGAKFASDFIASACVSSRRESEDSVSEFGNLAVRLVAEMDLDIPLNVEYMKDWSVYAAAAMDINSEIPCYDVDLPAPELIEKRFEEHIRAGIAVNTPATGQFGALLPAGVKRGWLSREAAVGIVYSALDASVSPGDRKVWLGVLDELGICDEVLSTRTRELIPLLASG